MIREVAQGVAEVVRSMALRVDGGVGIFCCCWAWASVFDEAAVGTSPDDLFYLEIKTNRNRQQGATASRPVWILCFRKTWVTGSVHYASSGPAPLTISLFVCRHVIYVFQIFKTSPHDVKKKKKVKRFFFLE